MHLVVHDVGGFYGLPFAAHHAERLATLTILNTPFASDFRWHRWGRLWRTAGLGELSMRLMSEWFFLRELRRASPRYPPEEGRAAYARYHRGARAGVLKLYRAMDPERFGPYEQPLREATARVPTQVLWGDLDPYIPVRFASLFGGTVRRFQDLGHWTFVERPAEIAAAIADWTTRWG